MATPRIPSVLAPFLLSLLAAPAPAQREAWSVEGRVHGEEFGSAIVLLADRTGDGVPELLVGAPQPFQYYTRTSYDRGVIRVLSGADLSLLLEIGGETYRDRRSWDPDDLFGAALANAGDVDGDGLEDFLAGAGNRATVDLLSGADGHAIRSFAGAVDSGFGTSVVFLGDVDGDATGDFAVGAPEELGPAGRRGVVSVVSGATGAVLRRRETATSKTGFGSRDRVAALPDRDGDGVTDLGVLDVKRAAGVDTGVVRVLSGASGAVLQTILFDHSGYENHDLVAIAPFGDADLDGTQDLVVGALNKSRWKPCVALVMSGADGSELRRKTLNGDAAWISVGSAGDLDGDGRDELIAGCDEGWNRGSRLRLFRGGDGALLQEFVEPALRGLGRAFAVGADFDGDGQDDVAVGVPDLPALATGPYPTTGAIDTRSWATGATIARRAGLFVCDSVGGVPAEVGDVDGDGRDDVVAVSNVFDPAAAAVVGVVRVHSGRDGATLAEHPVAGGVVQALAALPDLDGDGCDDYAATIGDGFSTAKLELRSSATGATLRTCFPPSYDSGFGTVVAVGIEPGGGARIAVGSPTRYGNMDGAFDLFDAATGAHLFRLVGSDADARFGHAIAFLGDVDGDATGDWIVGAITDSVAAYEAGRATVVSGADGSTLVDLFGGAEWACFGSGVAAIGDQDGDTIGDVAIGASGGGPAWEGEVHLYSGATWTPFATLLGPATSSEFGDFLAATGDVQRDGNADWVIGTRAEAPLELRHGATRATMTLLEREPVLPPSWRSRTSTRGRVDGYLRTMQDLHWPAGMLARVDLRALFLDVVPPVAQQGSFVVATTRGGVPTLFAALEFVALDGVPVGSFVDFGTFDPAGDWRLSDVIGPGLAGHVVELRAWAIDARGKLVESEVATLELQ